MPMHRKNKGSNRPKGSMSDYQAWFFPNKRRQRRRNEIAVMSRRKNHARK